MEDITITDESVRRPPPFPPEARRLITYNTEHEVIVAGTPVTMVLKPAAGARVACGTSRDHAPHKICARRVELARVKVTCKQYFLRLTADLGAWISRLIFFSDCLNLHRFRPHTDKLKHTP